MSAARHMHPARYLLTVGGVRQHRHLLTANGLGMDTARVKATACGRIDGVGRVTGQGRLFGAPVGV